MYSKIKKRVFEANIKLPQYGLVTFTWGNVSQINREKKIVAIKPSGVHYDVMKEEDIVITDLEGRVIDGKLRPSSDLPTHLKLYKELHTIGGIVHTHSTWATACAQAGKSVEAYGTTHGDYFHGAIPCTRSMTNDEMAGDYEAETGNVIVQTLEKLDPLFMPSVLVKNHGPFVWGKDCFEAVENAVVLEEVCKLFVLTKLVNPFAEPISGALLNKHFFRKHGETAYYGQKETN